jgi:hypothetical protein
MKREWNVLTPRVAGDTVLFDQTLLHGINAMKVLVKIFNCEDNPATPEQNSINFKYSHGVRALKQSNIGDEDIVVFVHNDVSFLDSNFKQKVEMIFDEKDVALLGFVGTKELKENGCWWDNPVNILRGHLIQGKRDKNNGEGIHLVKGQIGFFDDVVAIDGLCMITLGKYLKSGGIEIDTATYQGNHFYDLDLSMSFLTKGYKIGIADILVYHKSEGDSNQSEQWMAERDKFIKKWKAKGIQFPVTYESIKEWRERNNIQTPDLNKQPQIIEIEI